MQGENVFSIQSCSLIIESSFNVPSIFTIVTRTHLIDGSSIWPISKHFPSFQPRLCSLPSRPFSSCQKDSLLPSWTLTRKDPSIYEHWLYQDSDAICRNLIRWQSEHMIRRPERPSCWEQRHQDGWRRLEIMLDHRVQRIITCQWTCLLRIFKPRE